jgi:hypothetical protein
MKIAAYLFPSIYFYMIKLIYNSYYAIRSQPAVSARSSPIHDGGCSNKPGSTLHACRQVASRQYAHSLPPGFFVY